MEKLKNTTPVFIALLLVTSNGFTDHYYAPNGILFTPLLIIACTLLIMFVAKELSLATRGLLCLLFIILNDVFIKFYGGGTHDSEGLGWINGFMFLGAVAAYIIIIIAIILNKTDSIVSKIISMLLVPLLFVVYWHFCSDLGLHVFR